MSEDVIFSRTDSVAERIERAIEECAASFDAALYRLNNPRLAEALAGLSRRGVRVRLLVDGGKYKEDSATRRLLETGRVPFRLIHGRLGPPSLSSSSSSKMHHKFVILDARTVLTGSYNWTTESEERNYENLVILRDPGLLREFQEEFEELWREAANKA